MKKLSKEELQKQLREILNEEERQIAMVHYPEFKKMEGKYFKYRNNYSCPEKPSDYWFMYTKVTEVKPEDVYMIGDGPTCYYNGWSFQTDKNGEIFIKLSEQGYAHRLQTEITEAEFLEAWNKLNNTLKSLI